MSWIEGQSLQSGKYRIKRKIGGGGFGLTYLAEDLNRSVKKPVVIKTPNTDFRDDLEYEKFIRRFQLEGQRLAKILHPNVVRVLDFFQEDGVPCLVMEYVTGETLSALVKRQGCLSEDEALLCFEKLAETLQAVHSEGLIHCDVHPGNIMIQYYYELPPVSDNSLKTKLVLKPVLIDFGSAKSLQPSTLTVTTTVNDFYSPHEQLERQTDSNPQQDWDLYALAATLYFAVMGEKPPYTRSRRDRDLLKSKIQKRKLNKGLSRAILKGMAMKPKNRPQSMQAWMELLIPPPPFPWVALGLLMLGYAAIGLLNGPSIGMVMFWSFGIGSEAKSEAGIVLSFVIMVWLGCGVGYEAWAESTTLVRSLVIAVVIAVVGVGVMIVGWAWAWATLGQVFGRAFLAMGIAIGMAMGGTVAVAKNRLQQHYRPQVTFFILAGVSTLGLILGGIFGWLLKLKGVTF